MSKRETQEYKGNGKHTWEIVQTLNDVQTDRLRVPGGWLYRVSVDNAYYHDNDTDIQHRVVFVPMPEVVKHKV